MIAGVHELTPVVGNAAACRALGLWRGTFARRHARLRRATLLGPPAPSPAPARPPLALTSCEQQALLDILNGMQNGPRGNSTNTPAGSSGMSLGLTDFLYQRDREIIAFARADLVL